MGPFPNVSFFPPRHDPRSSFIRILLEVGCKADSSALPQINEGEFLRMGLWSLHLIKSPGRFLCTLKFEKL